MKLLVEFIRLNVNELFGLDKQVTMNALRDVVGGPGLSFKVNDQNIFVVDEVKPEFTDQQSLRNLSTDIIAASNDDLDNNAV